MPMTWNWKRKTKRRYNNPSKTMERYISTYVDIVSSHVAETDNPLSAKQEYDYSRSTDFFSIKGMSL